MINSPDQQAKNHASMGATGVLAEDSRVSFFVPAVISGSQDSPTTPIGYLGEADLPVFQHKFEPTVKNFHDYIQNQQRQIQVRIGHEDSHSCIKVIDSRTNEVLRLIGQQEMTLLYRFMPGGPGSGK